ncbi:MAG: hypothetical protein ACK4K2_00295 [Dehalococcoidia bacterium]
MGLFSRRPVDKKEGNTPAAQPAPQAEQPAPEPGENPLAATMPWLQGAGSPLSLGETAPPPEPAQQTEATPAPTQQASAENPQGQAASPAPKPQETPGNGNGLSDDLRALFASEGSADPELQGLASGLDDVDIQQLANLARQTASMVRR